FIGIDNITIKRVIKMLVKKPESSHRPETMILKNRDKQNKPSNRVIFEYNFLKSSFFTTKPNSKTNSPIRILGIALAKSVNGRLAQNRANKKLYGLRSLVIYYFRIIFFIKLAESREIYNKR